jgi:hypothetical protein
MSVNIRGGGVNSGDLSDIRNTYHGLLQVGKQDWNQIKEHAAQKAGYVKGQFQKQSGNFKELSGGIEKQVMDVLAQIPKPEHAARLLERAEPKVQKFLNDNIKKAMGGSFEPRRMPRGALGPSGPAVNAERPIPGPAGVRRPERARAEEFRQNGLKGKNTAFGAGARGSDQILAQGQSDGQA